MGERLLGVKNLTKHFGGVFAVEDFSFHVETNAILGLIGPNGSGKTTLLNSINGLYHADGGQVLYKSGELVGKQPYAIAQIGIGRTFQVPRIFKRMTVLENMMTPVLYSPEPDAALHARARELLERATLDGVENTLGEELSGGQQKLLELARVLMFDPDLLLLDEPFAGVHPTLKAMFHDQILQMRDNGKTFILVSHDLTSIYTLCDHILVMDLGRKIGEGTSDEIKRDERVIEAYLGA